MPELAKQYRPADVEPMILDRWNSAKAFHADPTKTGDPFGVLIPPPNVTAALHMGHALNNTLQDILIRWRRMAGDNAMWMPGTDHAGIATQTVVEKRVLAEQGKKRTEFKREDFVKLIQAWKDEYEATITNQLKTMGCSCDWDRQRFTMDPVCAAAVREAFFQLFKDGLIYRGKRLVNWDPATQTALADDEVEMEETDGHFYYLNYPLSDGSGFVTVATTRPETMLGDTAVAVNPNDPRAASLHGKFIKLPIVNRLIPIIHDEYVVLPDPNGDEKAKFSSGFLKVTPAHDENDWTLGQRHKLGVINIFSPTAAISFDHGWAPADRAQADPFLAQLVGKDRFEARKMILRWFKEQGLFVEQKPYRHSVGHSYRSHVPIEPYLSDQWYVKVTDDRLAGAALRALKKDSEPDSVSPDRAHSARLCPNKSWEGQLRIIPERYARTYQTWHENIRDWCISRQLWWGHRIPVWSGPKQQLQSINPEKASVQHMGEQTHVCLRENDPQIIQQLEQAGFVQDPDVLDTWFSSALWPISTLGWPNPGKFPEIFPDGDAALSKWNPSHTLSTAREIITLWVSRMVMFNLYFRDCLPFTNVFIHAMIQDGEGRKMSKSLGNGVDPLDIIHSHGSDAMRFTLAKMTTNTQDVRLPVVRDPASGKNTSEKFDEGRNFSNKIWNAVRFAFSYLQEPLPQSQSPGMATQSPGMAMPGLSLADRWILARLAQVTQDSTAALENYEFSNYAQGLYDFIWRDLCDWYIEAVKPTLKQSALQRDVLATCLDVMLRLLHPVMPFITETLWEHLNAIAADRAQGVLGKLLVGNDMAPKTLLIGSAWPVVKAEYLDAAAQEEFALMQQVIGSLREVRTTNKVPPRQKVTISIKAADPIAARLLAQRDLVQTLANVEYQDVGPQTAKPADAATTMAAGAELYVHGVVDADAEQSRLTKRLEDLNKSIATLEGRLANKSYTDRAPAHLVEQTRQQLEKARQERDAVQAQINAAAGQ